MSNLITGLNPDQQRELAILLRKNPASNLAIAGIIEDHLNGNSEAYNQTIGVDKISPAVAAFIQKSVTHREAAADIIAKSKV